MKKNILKCALGASILTGIALPLAGCSCTIHNDGPEPEPPTPPVVDLVLEEEGEGITSGVFIPPGSSGQPFELPAGVGFDNISYQGDLNLMSESQIVVFSETESFTWDDNGSDFIYNEVSPGHLIIQVTLSGTPTYTQPLDANMGFKIISTTNPQKTYYQSVNNHINFKEES